MQAMGKPTLLNPGGESTLMDGHSADPGKQSHTRACAMCVKAKAKCMSHPEVEGVCQRYVNIP